jgi:hypothetical protein
MEEKPYPFESNRSEFTYHFESVSEHKTVQKTVLITETGIPNVANLALLDVLPNGEFSDTTVTDNDDLITVLATVFRIAQDFLNRFPNYSLVFQGSDDRRNRLYRIALGRELVYLEKEYEVHGFNGENFVLFSRSQPFSGFLIRKRR